MALFTINLQKVYLLYLIFPFLAAEGAALEATIWVSGSQEISVLVMHFQVRPCPFRQCTYKVPYFRQWVKANLVPSVSACVKQPILTWTWTDHYTYLTQSDHWAWTWTDHYAQLRMKIQWVWTWMDHYIFLQILNLFYLLQLLRTFEVLVLI